MIIIEQRRKVAQEWTAAGQIVWSFRFDTPAWDAKENEGALYGVEVGYVFQNIAGKLGDLRAMKAHLMVAESIGTYYVNFINRHDPNPAVDYQTGSVDLPKWPVYKDEAVNMAFHPDGLHTEKDDWRSEGIRFINSISREILA